MRNVFSTEKITYIEKTGKVLYRSRMQEGNNKKNFVVYSAAEFIAAITQHIPKKNFQMVRYYGWYSNKSRGVRAKTQIPVENGHLKAEKSIEERILEQRELAHKPIHLDVSKHRSKNSPSLMWRECTKKIWKEGPLICPKCFPLT